MTVLATWFVCAYALRAKEPPAEIQLWKAGDNPTDYGVHLWTAQSADLVGGAYAVRGNPLQIDVEHLGAEPPKDGEPPPTGGYARLELRNGEPWLVFDWSTYAVDQIRTGQRLFLSPEYTVDKRTGEIVGLTRVSLVGDPGTHHARMLASASGKGSSMDPKLLQQALDALMSGDDKKCAEILKAMVVSSASGTPAQPADAATEQMAAPPPPASDAPAAPAADDPEKKKPATAARAASPSAAVQASTAVSQTAATATATAAPSALELRFDAFERDRILEKHGSRLAEPQRVWASTQPFAVVKGLIEATPDATPPARTAAATRGATQGTDQRASALPPTERADLDARMGRGASAPAIRREGKAIVFGAMTQAEARRVLASRNAGKETK